MSRSQNSAQNRKDAGIRDQYKSDGNLRSRIHLHARYSVNPTPWMTWVFDQLMLAPTDRVLELGAGPGTLWDANRSRLPQTCSITLTDRSGGMIRKARKTLEGLNAPIAYGIADAQDLPFPDARFTTAIANHMLYHVPDRGRALTEIDRVLEKNGTLYATTVGESHMREMWQLLSPMIPNILTRVGAVSQGFTLENGAALLSRTFAHIERRNYEDSLVITEVEPVLKYLDSTTMIMDLELTQAQRETLREAIAARIRAEGAFRVKKASGLFIARKT